MPCKCHAPREFEGKEIGYLNIAVVENQKTGIRLSYLDEVQLQSESPLFSGIGLGTTALELFSKISDELGCKWSSLRVVTDSLHAGRLYEKFGFRVTERSIRRLERFGIAPGAFVKDTSSSRKFSPPICMYRLIGTEILDPLNHIDLDLLCIRREPGKPLAITPEKRKAIEELPLREKENLMPKAEEESMDSLFGGLGMDSASSSPKRNSPLKHEDSASISQAVCSRLAPSMRKSLMMAFSSSDDRRKEEMMDSFDLSFGGLDESSQSSLTSKDFSLEESIDTSSTQGPYTSTPFKPTKRRCLSEKIFLPDEGKGESFMFQDQDERGSVMGIRSLPTSPQRHSPGAFPMQYEGSRASVVETACLDFPASSETRRTMELFSQDERRCDMEVRSAPSSPQSRLIPKMSPSKQLFLRAVAPSLFSSGALLRELI